MLENAKLLVAGVIICALLVLLWTVCKVAVEQENKARQLYAEVQKLQHQIRILEIKLEKHGPE